MATVLTSPAFSETAQGYEERHELKFATGLVTVLTMLAVAVHGYHPYAEDGGLYMAGVKHLLDPGMYPHVTEFVMGHLRFSMFAPLVAELARGSGLSVEMVLLLVHLATFWVTLFAAWLLAARCFAGREARVGAVSLLAAWMTLPIAGTSLMLMDPYVTARSISTPCVLLALVGTLEFLLPGHALRARTGHGLALCCGALAIAALMHPLMAAYGLGCVLALGSVVSGSRQMRVWGTVGLGATALMVATVVYLLAPPESLAYRQVALTRYYWFLTEWHWYECVGLIAPLVILTVVGLGGRGFGRPTFERRGNEDAARIALARMAVVVGLVCVAVALLFARTGSATYLVARLQPLRVFQPVYIVMILMVGATLGEKVLRRRPARCIVAMATLGGMMVLVERQTFPGSTHIELPRAYTSTVPLGGWQQAFVWISQNTPKDALFALDAHYITEPGEDAQGFRAIAERSALPDFSKDGGEAAITPALTAAWAVGQAVQTGLSLQPDAQRIAALKPLGVTWVVLDRGAVTGFACDFANVMVKVCRLPR